MAHERFLVNLAPAVSTDVCRWMFEFWNLTLAWYRTSNDQLSLIVGRISFAQYSQLLQHMRLVWRSFMVATPAGENVAACFRASDLP